MLNWRISKPNSIPLLVVFRLTTEVYILKKEILIYGGYNHDNEATDQAFLFDTQTNILKTNNENKLPFAEGFWNNSPLIY